MVDNTKSLRYECIDPEEQVNSENFSFIERFLKKTNRFALGWHYITDLTWIYAQVKHWPREYKILDAGGGGGPLQFLLTELGFDVTNIDMVLELPSQRYVDRYEATYTTLPSYCPTDYVVHLKSYKRKLSGRIINNAKTLIRNNGLYQTVKLSQYNSVHNRWRRSASINEIPIGQLNWVQGNLCAIPEIGNASFDAIVSLSAIEHIPEKLLPQALMELRRVLCPDAKWAVTTSCTEQKKSWFHEPSQGMCFSTNDIESLFNSIPVQKQMPDQVLEKYKNCSYLKENISSFYEKSSNNGMPWGKWQPKYIPVGLVK